MIISKFFSKTQSRSNNEARHIYSNPINPTVCPIHSVASYLLFFPGVFIDGGKLFPGLNQKKDSMTFFIEFWKAIKIYFRQFTLALQKLDHTPYVKERQSIALWVLTLNHQ